MKSTFFLSLVALLAFGLAHSPDAFGSLRPQDRPHRDPLEAEITAIVEQLHAASSAGNVAGIESLISRSPDALFLGAEGTEVFLGHDQIVRWWAGQFAFFDALGYPHGGLRVVSDGRLLQVRRVGDLVLAADQAVWRFHRGDVTFRLTLVLRKEGGRWKILQGQYSNLKAGGSLPL